MNWYFYWYFTIYSIYKRFSWDKDFDLFATGLFSLLITLSLNCIIIIIALFFSYKEIIIYSKYFLISSFIVLFIVNGFVFLRKDWRDRNYAIYKEKRKVIKDIISVSVSVLIFIGLLILSIFSRDLF